MFVCKPGWSYHRLTGMEEEPAKREMHKYWGVIEDKYKEGIEDSMEPNSS